MVTPVRLLAEAVSIALSRSHRDIVVQHVRDLDSLEDLMARHLPLEMVIVDTTQPIDLNHVRQFHKAHLALPLLALGLREQEKEIIAHGRAGFLGYLSREDGLERLCAIVEDAIEGRMTCPPEVTAALMRSLFDERPGPATPLAPPLDIQLTPREQEIERLVVRGLSNKEIAREFNLSASTVKHHVHSILQKMAVPSRIQLMRARNEDWRSDLPRSVNG